MIRPNLDSSRAWFSRLVRGSFFDFVRHQPPPPTWTHSMVWAQVKPSRGERWSIFVQVSKVLLPIYASRYQLCVLWTDCGAKNEIRSREPIRCKECGHRIMYKKRTTRSKYLIFASSLVPNHRTSCSIRGEVNQRGTKLCGSGDHRSSTVCPDCIEKHVSM
jgi:DNA-directed RNA polymerase I, II, and III subunit RPABC4